MSTCLLGASIVEDISVLSIGYQSCITALATISLVEVPQEQVSFPQQVIVILQEEVPQDLDYSVKQS